MTTITKGVTIKPVNIINTLILIRGLPGSGKTTLANLIDNASTNTLCIATDDFFMQDGDYKFNGNELAINHEKCYKYVADKINKSSALTTTIVVHNTFSMFWEMSNFINHALEAETTWHVKIIDLYDAGLTDDELLTRSIHGVPIESIKRMRDRWQQWSWEEYSNWIDKGFSEKEIRKLSQYDSSSPYL